MNINFNSFPSYAVSLLRENVLPSLTAQHKKILVIASIAFVFMAACYAVVYHCRCFKFMNHDEGEMEKEKKSDEKVEEELCEDNVLKQPKTNPTPTLKPLSDQYGALDGNGTRTLVSGAVLVGEFANGFLNGLGKATWEDKTIEEGYFKNNSLNGTGTRITFGGQVSQGVFKGGILNGPGTITFCDGDVHQGVFENGLLHGYGMKTYVSGEVTEGEFENGFLLKTIPNLKPKSDKFGVITGQGKRTFSDGKIVDGNLEGGKLNGQGKVILADGTIEEGEFKNGLLNGEGKITLTGTSMSKRKRLEGTFRNGALNEGMITYCDGRVEKVDYLKITS